MAAVTESALISPAARRYAMVVLAVVYMVNFVDRQILAILLPAIRDEFRVSDTVLGLLAGTAFALFYVSVGIPVARIADRVNRRNLIAAAVAIWSGMTALSGFAANVTHLALARIGVGIGEAGCSPPAHSIIADLYPPEKRSAAMGFYSLGISAGIMLAYLAGGWIVENFNWRAAFFLVGLPGLVLAGIVRFTLPEPARGSIENRNDSGRQPGLAVALRLMLSCRTFVRLALAAGLASLVGYSIISWMPSFAARSFGASMSSLGLWLGLIFGLAGGAGLYLGGLMADRIARTGRRNMLRFIAVATLLSAPLYLFAFLSPSIKQTLLLFIVPTLFSYAYLAPVLGQVQGLVALRMRSVASAVMLLVMNILGYAIGPPATGMISDVLQARFGDESLRYALIIVAVVFLPIASWFFVMAGRTLGGDLARAADYD